MHLLEVGKYKILVDCGLDYEKATRQEDNELFPFDPADIDVVILTHAHIDHSGNLPTLLRMGFEGQIVCTSPTAELAELLLLDSVNLFLGKTNKKRRRSRGSSGPRPLYLQSHVMDTVGQFITIGFNRPFRLNGDVEMELVPAGHLLGAASVLLRVTEHGLTRTIALSGDIGRKNYPVLVDPQPLPQVDYLVCESTYGGRYHRDTEAVEEVLRSTIEETCIKTPGRLIIPAFSIGRTQALVYSLNKIFSTGQLPPVKIFVDSPLANYATEVYRKHHAQLSEDARSFYNRNGDEFEFENLHYVQNMKESKSLSNYFEPCIIVSSAGMLEGGRIQDHLYHNLQNYYCTILFVGYSAKGTLGHRLLRGDQFVHVRDRKLAVYAKIKQTDVLSGHGDHTDLVSLVSAQNKEQLKSVFLVHGEPQNMLMLQDDLVSKGYHVTIPEKGQTFEL